MLGLFTGIAGKIGMSLLTSLLTEKVLMGLIFKLLERLVERTDNDIDDQLLKDVQAAFNTQQDEQVKQTKQTQIKKDK